MDAMLDVPTSAARHVAVAIDAAGGGGIRRYTYVVPPELADLEPGEAVLVEFGRRQAVAVVLGDAPPPDGITAKPIASRVRADGPLLPPLVPAARRLDRRPLPRATGDRRPGDAAAGLARASRAARRADGDRRAGRPAPRAIATCSTSSRDGQRPVRDLVSVEGRAGLLRRLRVARRPRPRHPRLDAPRRRRRAALRALGPADRRRASRRLGQSRRATATGRPLGPRQLAVLAELLADARDPAGPGLPRRAARRPPREPAPWRPSSAAGSSRSRSASGRAGRWPPGRPVCAGAGPPAPTLTDAQAEAVAVVRAAVVAGDPRPILLDGVTGGGKTAIYVEAIVASLRARPAGPRRSSRRSRWPCRSSTGSAPISTPGSRSSTRGSGDGERADEWRRIRSGDVDVVVGTRLAVARAAGRRRAHRRRRGARRRLQERPDAPAPGARHGDPRSRSWPARRSCSAARRRRSSRSGGRARAATGGSSCRTARPARGRAIEVVDLREELKAGNRGLLSDRLVDAMAALDRAAGDQAILTINRRGTASVVLCRDCGHVQTCPECERPLVYHQAGTTLRCHHCGRATPIATRCPNCGSPRIRYLGGGTQRVEEEVRRRFPDLRVGRLDRDVVERRGAAERVDRRLRRRRAGRPRRDEPRDEGPRHPGGDARRRRVGGRRPQPAGRAGRGADLPAPRPGRRPRRAGRPARASRSSSPTSPSTRRSRPSPTDDAATFYDSRARPPPPVRVAAVRRAREADRRPAGPRRPPSARPARWSSGSASGPPSGAATRSSSGRRPAYIARRADRWRWNVVLRGSDPAALLDGGLEPPWSVDVDPDSLL